MCQNAESSSVGGEVLPEDGIEISGSYQLLINSARIVKGKILVVK